MSIAVDNNTKSGYYDSDAGKVHTGERMKLNWNGSSTRNYQPNHYFINLMLKYPGVSTSGGVIVDSNRWGDCRAAGATASYWFWSSPANSRPSWDTTLVVRWTEQDLSNLSTVTMTSGATDNGDLAYNGSVGRKTFTFSEVSGSMILSIEDGYATDIEVMHLTDETAYDAGETISSQFISDFGNATSMRFMQESDSNDSDTYDYSHYTRASDNPRGFDRYLPYPRMMEICNKLQAEPWICIPFMANDQCVTDIADACFAALDTNLRIRVEYGNEGWNSGGIFKGGFNWLNYENAPLYISEAFDGVTTTVTQTAHGFVTGLQVVMFNVPGDSYSTREIQSTFPYEQGADQPNFTTVYVDANTFYLAQWDNCQTAIIESISKTTTAVVTMTGAVNPHPYEDGQVIRIFSVEGMDEVEDNDYMVRNPTATGFDLYDAATGLVPVDSRAFGTYTANSGFVVVNASESRQPNYDNRWDASHGQTEIRYKLPSEASGWGPQSNGRRSKEIWTIFDGIFGRDRVVAIIQEQSQNDSDMRSCLNQCRDRFDYIATAPYFNIGTSADIPGFVDYPSTTPTMLTDYIIDNDYPYDNAYNRLDGIKRMINDAAYCYRYITYEGGDHSTGATGDKSDAVKRWHEDPEITRVYKAYMQRLAELGVKEHTIYQMSADDTAGNGSYVGWGSMLHTGDQTNPKYIAADAYLSVGGVPKP